MEPIKQKSGPYLFKGSDNAPPRWTVIMNDGSHIPYPRLLMMNFLHTANIPKAFVVHHLNGVTDDDRIENLTILSKIQHDRLHHPKDYKYGVSGTDDWKAYRKAYLVKYRAEHPDWKEVRDKANHDYYQKNKDDPAFIMENRRRVAEYHRKKKMEAINEI
jgi:hypothetical protein